MHGMCFDGKWICLFTGFISIRAPFFSGSGCLVFWKSKTETIGCVSLSLAFLFWQTAREFAHLCCLNNFVSFKHSKQDRSNEHTKLSYVGMAEESRAILKENEKWSYQTKISNKKPKTVPRKKHFFACICEELKDERNRTFLNLSWKFHKWKKRIGLKHWIYWTNAHTKTYIFQNIYSVSLSV